MPLTTDTSGTTKMPGGNTPGTMPGANPLFLDPDPIKLARVLWPGVQFYDKQVEVIYSVEENDLTIVPAGNKLGKDFVAGFIALKHFLSAKETRVITTSVKDDHLRVLWGEIGRFIRNSKYPLTADKGGPLHVNHRDIRKVINKNGDLCPISYLRGMVSERGEGLAGHHAEHTLLIIDEASGVDDAVLAFGETWAKRILVLGNPNPTPPSHFFYKGVKDGDLLAG